MWHKHFGKGMDKMKSVIVKVNYQRARAVFLREDGEYGWFEILDTTEVEPDEVVSGNFDDLGGTTIRKQTGETVDIFIEDFCSLKIALEMVFPDRR